METDVESPSATRSHTILYVNSWHDTHDRSEANPTYRFVERDTGPSDYFSIPLVRAYKIFSEAYSELAGTARGVRGPSMSASPGKICILGVETIAGQRVIVLKFYQARKPDWTKHIFFAEFDPKATWIDDLKPAFGAHKFFYEDEYDFIHTRQYEGSSGQFTW
jgi:hypothetical protein